MFQPNFHSEGFDSTAMATTNVWKVLDKVCPQVNTSGDGQASFKTNA